MKKILLIVCMFVSSNTFADELCKDLYDMSYKIMNMRQWGTPIVKQMDTIDKMEKGNPKIKPITNLLRKVIVSAYETPRFEVKENQVKAAQNFANEWASTCYKIPAK